MYEICIYIFLEELCLWRGLWGRLTKKSMDKIQIYEILNNFIEIKK